ncbi:hypothetical protein [uncultured Pelagimonas sp.]|uniref:hypothetical protein n=1 Tax=uncultured Pelagimonas sp. TaxID=1618102 RepID=UPI00261F7151|nr:hypothetical protein [uncultured Pelagimonas sp.]
MDYLTHYEPLAPAQIPAELIDALESRNGGQAFLKVHLYYMKDARRRGLKLSICRVVKGGAWENTFPMSSYNGLIHVCDLKRQNNKTGEVYAQIIRDNMDAITVMALTTMAPDFTKIMHLIDTAATPKAAA